MRQRGRRGELSGFNVVDISEIARPEPPRVLSPAEGQIWRDTVAGMRSGWSWKATYPLLSAYCIQVHSRVHGGGKERKAPSVSRDSQGTSTKAAGRDGYNSGGRNLSTIFPARLAWL